MELGFQGRMGEITPSDYSSLSIYDQASTLD